MYIFGFWNSAVTRIALVSLCHVQIMANEDIPPCDGPRQRKAPKTIAWGLVNVHFRFLEFRSDSNSSSFFMPCTNHGKRRHSTLRRSSSKESPENDSLGTSECTFSVFGIPQ